MAATYKQTKPYNISLSLNAFQSHTLLSLGSNEVKDLFLTDLCCVFLTVFNYFIILLAIF